MAPITAIALFVVGCLNLALIADVARQLLSPGRAGVDHAAWDAHVPSSIAGTIDRKPMEAYAPIFAHPVFFKSREPFVPPPSTPAPTSPLPPATIVDSGLVVGGVMLKSGVAKAYLLSKGGAGGSWVEEQETFQGWQIKSIDESGVHLEQGNRSIELQLYPRN